MTQQLQQLLAQVAQGSLSVQDAIQAIHGQYEKGMGFARIDLHRQCRRGFPEVIFCPGKTSDQIEKIMAAILEAGQNVFASRASRDQFEHIKSHFTDAVFHSEARAITIDRFPLPSPAGLICVVTAGTSDIPVAQEAALTAERLGSNVDRLFDVGVAGLHRLVNQLDRLKKANAIIAVAGMEGALPSVIGGLVDRPIIAVPTSVGYGTHLNGWAPLLAMLNTCAPGISVVNIDNGFGAGICAAMINKRSIPIDDSI